MRKCSELQKFEKNKMFLLLCTQITDLRIRKLTLWVYGLLYYIM